MSRQYVSSNIANGQKFVQGLKDSGAISSTLMAFYLSSDTNTQSYVELGGYTTTIIRSGESLQAVPLNASFYWLGSVDGFRVGTTEVLSGGTVMGYYTDVSEAIFDTGTSLLTGPSSVISEMISLLTSGIYSE